MEKVFYQIFEQLPRVGPGDYDSTKKAFNILRQVKALPENPKILDMGCGTGLHTLDLAEISGAHITALDRHREFLNKLVKQVTEQGLAKQIHCVLGDMGAMDFEPQSFDIIWAEGSIFILGLEKGLNLWKKFLNPGGMMALTDLFWFKPGAPKEVKTFFEQISPGMMGLAEAKQVIEGCGYRYVDHFQLPDSAWWDDFYGPLEKVLKDSGGKYGDTPETLGTIQSLEKEIYMFRNYSEYYGYFFFILENK